jgi:hypothetical protein
MSIELKVIAIATLLVSIMAGAIAFGHHEHTLGVIEGKNAVLVKWDAQRQAQLAEQAQREAQYRADEATFHAKSQEIENELAKEKTATAAALARAATTERLRAAAVSAYASVVSGMPGDTGASPRLAEHAATLGVLLNTCRDQATSDATELEGLASQVRGLIHSYQSIQGEKP